MHDPSPPAPGRLEELRGFANSLDCYRDRDELADLDQTRDLLRRLAGGQVADNFEGTDAALSALRRARAGIRAALGCSVLWALPGKAQDKAQDSESGDAVGLSVASLSLQVSTDGVVVHPGSGPMEGFLAPLFLELLVATRSGTASRLKVCSNINCQWVFWDSSRPGSARWCSMRICGAQAKSRSYRERKVRGELD